MAVAVDQVLGSNAPTPGTTSSTTITLSTLNAVSAGGFISLLVGGLGAVVNAGSGGGLSWFVDKTITNGSLNLGLISAYAPAGLAASTVVTATFSAAATSRAIGGFSLSGVQATSPVDTAASATGSSSAAYTCGACNTSAAGIVIGAAMVDDFNEATGETPTSPWLQVTGSSGFFVVTGNGDSYTLIYRITTGPGSFTPGGTWTGASLSWAGCSAAYLADTGAAAINPAFAPRRMPLGV